MRLVFLNPYAIYHKVPKFLDARKLCCNLPKIQTYRALFQKDANEISNSQDPDQTASLFAQTYLSEKVGSLRYIFLRHLAVCYKPKFVHNSGFFLKQYLWCMIIQILGFLRLAEKTNGDIGLRTVEQIW